MATVQYYNYRVSAEYIKPNHSPIEIDSNTIQAIIINHNYKKSMPIIYVTVKIRTDLFNDMEKNANVSSIILSIDKVPKNSPLGMRQTFIRGSFSYLIPNTPDTNRELDGSMDSLSYKVVTLGLYSLDILNGNNIAYGSENNMIIKNTDMQSIVYHFTQHLPLIMEPFKDREELPLVVIPPVSSINNLLTYLNKVHSFYNSSFTYYRDFKYAYLLSNTSNVKTDVMQYSDVIIRFLDTSEYKARLLSVEVDKEKDAYIVNVDASTMSVVVDNVTNKKFNSLIAITPNGETRQVDTTFGRTDDRISNKERVIRLPYNDFGLLDNMVDDIREGFHIEFMKNEIDTSIFTPNRVYHIQNFSSFSLFDGKFKLASKRDILIQNNDSFISRTYIQLYKTE